MDDKFLKYSKTLRVTYVYEDAIGDLSLYKQIFKSVTPYTYDEFIQNSNALSDDIIFINFTQKDIKSLYIALSNLSCKKVIFTPYENNPTFLKNALKFKIDAVMKQTTDEKTLSTLFHNLVKSISYEYKEKTQFKRFETIINANMHGFIYINNDSITYMSDFLKDMFEVQSATQFYDTYIKNGTQTQLVDLLLTPDVQKYLQVTTLNDKTLSFVALSKKVDNSTILSLTPIDNFPQQNSTADRFLNRIGFIEELKNQIVHQDKKQVCAVNVVMVQITNQDLINKEFGSYNTFAFSNEFATYVKEMVDKEATIASWGTDGFVVLSEALSYESLQTQLREFTKQINYKVFENNIVPFVKTALIKIEKDDLNEVISLIDNFFTSQVPLEQAKKFAYDEICQIKENAHDKKTLLYYFSNIMYTQTPLKLLNIYKGVHISTTAHIEKIDGTRIIVKAKNIQLYTMQLEKKNVIQCTSLPKDVEVDVELVDLKRNIAVFTNPKLLEFSANNRETTRVQSDFRFPVKMKQEKITHSGEILDLSMRSVAIKFPQSIKSQFSQGKVIISFRVPVETHDEGFFQTQIEGKLIRFDDIDHKYIKAIVLLNMEEPDEGYVLEYIYKRQKEIIFEIKKLALKGLANGF